MTLTPAKKNILGLLWIWPPVYMVLFNLAFFMMMHNLQAQGSHDKFNSPFIWMFGVIFVVHMLTALSMLAQMVFYIWHATTQNHLLKSNGSSQIIWILLLFFFNFISIPAYWYKYIYNDLPPEQPEDMDVAERMA